MRLVATISKVEDLQKVERELGADRFEFRSVSHGAEFVREY